MEWLLNPRLKRRAFSQIFAAWFFVAAVNAMLVAFLAFIHLLNIARSPCWKRFLLVESDGPDWCVTGEWCWRRRRDYISVKTYLCNSRVFRAVGVVEWVVAFTLVKLIFVCMPYKSFRALLQFWWHWDPQVLMVMMMKIIAWMRLQLQYLRPTQSSSDYHLTG